MSDRSSSVASDGIGDINMQNNQPILLSHWPSKLRNDFACQVTTISCKLFIFSASTFKN